jgi:alpha-L-fucosidase
MVPEQAATQGTAASEKMEQTMNTKRGAQRLSIEQLDQWRKLDYGMFIHFGMSTFVGCELPFGRSPSTTYAPDALDVDQWISVARDAGMKYAVLTTKHVSGHCLWPSKHTDYHVGTSGCKTDVVEAFVTACSRHGLIPGLYYCTWDNHHMKQFGAVSPSALPGLSYTSRAYEDFQFAQIEELLTQYGPIGEMWIDIPSTFSDSGRYLQYEMIARLQPQTVIMMNQGFGDGSELRQKDVWPTDLIAIERWLPNSNRGFNPWFKVKLPNNGLPNENDNPARQSPPNWCHPAIEAEYYIPGEVCDPIGYEWFYSENDKLRSDRELLGMRLIAHERQVNLLLDVPPNKHGQIPQMHVDALLRLRQNFDRI